MEMFLSYLTNPIVLAVEGLIVGVLFSQKIKDWVSGTSAEFRVAMTSVETKAKSDVKVAVADVFSKIVPVPAVQQAAGVVVPAVAAPVIVSATAMPAAPLAPVVPAPAAPLAPAAPETPHV